MKPYLEKYFKNLPHWNEGMGGCCITCPYCGREIMLDTMLQEHCCPECLAKIDNNQ